MKGDSVTMRWFLRPPRPIRTALVGLTATMMIMTGATSASADVGSDAWSEPATPGVSTDRSELLELGEETLHAALERDLGMSRTEVDELRAAARAGGKLADELRADLGSAYAGSWLDPESGALTVAVADEQVAGLAIAAGAETTVVSHSLPELESITDEFDALVEEAPGALAEVYSWGIEVQRNQVVVTVAEGRSGAIEPLLARYGDAVTIEESPYQPRLAQQFPWLDGGIPYNGCSSGFNMRNTSNGNTYFLTAGHCGDTGDQAVASNGVSIGPFVDSRFPGNDDALVQVTNSVWNQGPYVWIYSGFVTNASQYTDAPVGTPICKSGRTTGLTCGTITAKNQTVTYSGGFTVTGLTRHNACVEPGDSGGPNLNASFTSPYPPEGVSSGAQLSGGQCLSNPVSWYYPMADSYPYYNSTYGVTL